MKDKKMMPNAEEDPLILPEELFQAYFDCRKNKRGTCNALGFEVDYESNLMELWREIVNGTYEPGKSIAFVVTKPVKREVFAADFRDRVVHHLIAAKIMPLLEATFIHDSYSCREGKGTQYGIKRINEFVRACSENYTRDCYILKMDIKSFFMNMNKRILYSKLEKFLLRNYQGRDKTLLLELIYKVIFNQPEENCHIKGKPEDWNGLPPEKSLFHVPKDQGLPIGNLTSQLFANFYLNCFDHYVKDTIGVKYYGRYVDDFVIVHEDKDFLLGLIPKLREFLLRERRAVLHPKKIYLQHYSKGVKFIGAVIKPGRVYVANRTKGSFYAKLTEFNRLAAEDKNYVREHAEYFVSSVNSYLGFMVHYSSYKIRRKILTEKVSTKWRKIYTVDDRFQKIVLRKDYKAFVRQQEKLKQRRRNYKRRRKSRSRQSAEE